VLTAICRIEAGIVGEAEPPEAVKYWVAVEMLKVQSKLLLICTVL
jgi:hypothetical protein